MKRKSITLYVPTVNDRLKDFDSLFGLWSQANIENSEIILDFSQCYFLRQNAVAFLGGLINLIRHRGGNIDIDLNSIRFDVRNNLEKNGFLFAFGKGGRTSIGNSIPYRQDLIQNKNDLIGYLKTKWLGRGWVHVSSGLADAIAGTVWEIYANAFEHGRSPIGVMSCGQHYPKWRELHLTVVDFGVGIPSNVRLHLNDLSLPADECIRWATRPGTTTKPKEGVPGGVGLSLLRDFIKIANGKLEIFSHDGYAFINKDQESFFPRNIYFEGTLVNIMVRCDEAFYKLASEPSDVSFF